MQTTKKPFDKDGWLFELKLDGIRCLIYVDGTTLINKQGEDISRIYPEIQLSNSVTSDVVLDGEIVVMTNGVPDFYALRSRSLLRDDFKINIASQTTPASFVAFDILSLGGKSLCDLPLHERKKILSANVEENDLSISRYVETHGTALFQKAVSNNLEGIIAKRMDSKYRCGKRSHDWLKIINPNFPLTRKLNKK